MRSIAIAAAALMLTASAAALAADQSPPAPPPSKAVRGTITSFDGKQQLSITSSGGEGVAVGVLTPKTYIFAVAPVKFEELTSKDFVGVTAEPGKNGHLTAEEIHVLPGVIGEGQYPWDYHPGGGSSSAMSMSSMTNGMASMGSAPVHSDSMTNGMAAPSANNELTVTYHGSQVVDGKCEGHAPADLKTACTGTTIMDVPPGTPIVRLVPATAGDLKPGLAATGRMVTMNGQNLWGSVVVEKNGTKPAF